MLSARFNFESELKHLHIGCYHAQNTASHDNFLMLLPVKTSFLKRQEDNCVVFIVFSCTLKEEEEERITDKTLLTIAAIFVGA